MYNKFYFLNIPKTINVALDINIMQNLYKIMEKHGIDTSANLKFYDHNSWNDFDDKTYVFTIFRDPVDRTLAEFTNLRVFDAFAKRKSDSGIHVDDTLDLRLEDLDFWLNKFYTPNFQTRTLFNGFDPPIEAIPERIKEIDLFLYDHQIADQNQQTLMANRILSDLGINETVKTPYMPLSRFEHGYAIDFYLNQVKNSPLEEKIRDLNRLDLMIYENKSNFHHL